MWCTGQKKSLSRSHLGQNPTNTPCGPEKNFAFQFHVAAEFNFSIWFCASNWACVIYSWKCDHHDIILCCRGQLSTERGHVFVVKHEGLARISFIMQVQCCVVIKKSFRSLFVLKVLIKWGLPCCRRLILESYGSYHLPYRYGFAFSFNGRRIYPFNKGLRIYGGGVPPPFWHVKKMYFCLWYELETLQVVGLAFLVQH